MTPAPQPPRTMDEITRRGMDALSRELGPTDAARFIVHFSGGSGDYTAEREQLFTGKTVAELAADIRRKVAPARDVP